MLCDILAFAVYGVKSIIREMVITQAGNYNPGRGLLIIAMLCHIGAFAKYGVKPIVWKRSIPQTGNHGVVFQKMEWLKRAFLL